MVQAIEVAVELSFLRFGVREAIPTTEAMSKPFDLPLLKVRLYLGIFSATCDAFVWPSFGSILWTRFWAREQCCLRARGSYFDPQTGAAF